ncbi:retrovirus-related Pol polyprotein from transposon opus [Trichonephila clavipes]|nr:retrovirus-related Pol polyprotein from transposon opus [Trichonephila clavipes]
MWLYYCKLRGANDFESVNQLIVADKMFEILDSETATHIGVLQGEEWYKPRDLGKQCDIFHASKGNPTMNLRELNGMIVKREVLLVVGKDLVPGISVEGASTIYLKGIFGPAVKCPLVYVPIGLATGGQVNVVHQQVLCAFGRSFGRRRVASTRCFGYVGEGPE